MNEVVEFRRKGGNGAREALAAALERLQIAPVADVMAKTDQILASLWWDGFKITPMKD